MLALSRAANSPGYPFTAGTAALRQAIASYLTRRWGAVGTGSDDTLPVIGTKELVAWLPTLLGLGPMILWSIRRWPIRPTWWVPRSQAVAQSPATTSISLRRPAGADLDQFAIEPDRSDPRR